MGSISEAAPPARTTTRHRVRRLRVTRDGLSTLVFLLPFLVVFGLFAWFPILRGFVMSVQETNLVSEPTFVGIENFQRVLADPLLGKAIGNTLWFTILALVVGEPATWTTASLPRIASTMAIVRDRSPRRSSTSRSARRPARSGSLTIAVTRSPRATRRRTTAPPMNPAPPVTTTRLAMLSATIRDDVDRSGR